MSDHQQWAFIESVQPKPDETQFDLAHALDAVVLVRAEIPDDGFTAATLGTERLGYGAVIGEDGLVVTIGYLVNEASEIWLTTNRGAVVPGFPLAYDQATGFALIQPLGKLDAPHLQRGLASDVAVGDSAFVIGHGGSAHALKTRLVAKREFDGYWEYVLDEAVYTAPPHPNWGGAALLGADGRLCAIGSLYIDQVMPQMPGQDGNMSVPVDLLEPIMTDLMSYGRTLKPARPWLGMFVSEVDAQLLVAGVYDDAPAAQTALRTGDVITEVGGLPVNGLATLFRTVWAQGTAGCEVPLTVHREGHSFEVRVPSVDRREFWRAPDLH